MSSSSSLFLTSSYPLPVARTNGDADRWIRISGRPLYESRSLPGMETEAEAEGEAAWHGRPLASPRHRQFRAARQGVEAEAHHLAAGPGRSSYVS